ncbi:MAG: hypothetical protein ACLSBB_04810 [Ruthenibacterium lactatiformans]
MAGNPLSHQNAGRQAVRLLLQRRRGEGAENYVLLKKSDDDGKTWSNRFWRLIRPET